MLQSAQPGPQLRSGKRFRSLKYAQVLLLSLLILSAGTGCRDGQAGVHSGGAKNIILMIGDGMGLSQVSAAFYYGDSLSSFTRFNDIGLMNTSSAREKVPDSAAGATAFACGVRTGNGTLGLAPSGDTLRNIVEIAHERGMETGLVTSGPVTHATPAGFFAHIDSRGRQDDIAIQLLNSPVDFFAGGGLKYFQNRKDGLDLMDGGGKFKIRTGGLDRPEDLDPGNRYGYVLADYGMPKVSEGSRDFLADASLLAIHRLSASGKGFFLMIEGAQIDWAGHENDADYLIEEQLDFDRTVGKVLDFAVKDANTLVIVLADHETGGFTLAAAKDNRGHSDYSEIQPVFATSSHSAALIPVFAYGPFSELFRGVYMNTDVFRKMTEILGAN